VLVPHQNVKDLMLRHDVVEAVQTSQFHIYAVHTIDEGIELLSGKTAGRRLPSGAFTPGSVHALVDAKLEVYARKNKKYV
jgi:ATP-dependent Lon protease